MFNNYKDTLNTDIHALSHHFDIGKLFKIIFWIALAIIIIPLIVICLIFSAVGDGFSDGVNDTFNTHNKF